MIADYYKLEENTLSSHFSDVFFDIPCPYCGLDNNDNMSAVPMGAFAAMKFRGYQDERKNSDSFFAPKQSFDNEGKSGLLGKYNDKFMNSVWGQYNRYSVHNIKSHIVYDSA